jgi:hypothetical protein
MYALVALSTVIQPLTAMGFTKSIKAHRCVSAGFTLFVKAIDFRKQKR